VNKQVVSAFFAGLLFSVGLVVGGMTQPSKVVGWLDFFGDWDPSLAFVMGGAVLVHTLLFRLVTKRESPVVAEVFQVPTRRDFTPRLVIGSALFGVGWGLGGFCPGPGIVSVPTLGSEALAFVVAMAAGVVLHETMDHYRSKKRAAKAAAQRAVADAS